MDIETTDSIVELRSATVGTIVTTGLTVTGITQTLVTEDIATTNLITKTFCKGTCGQTEGAFFIANAVIDALIFFRFAQPLFEETENDTSPD
jgi:hypothetical protein